MESSGSHRSGLLTAGGALSVAAGIYLIVVGVSMAFLLMGASTVLPSGVRVWQEFIGHSPFYPFFVFWPSYQWVTIGGCVGILGIVAIVGGISAIRRKSYGLSLAGAICALPSVILGILAIIFVSPSRREFKG